MKRSDSPPLGANYGATVRLEGPNAPLAVFRPVSELERIRNPFLPPDARTQLPIATGTQVPVDAGAQAPVRAAAQEPVGAEIDGLMAPHEGRESDVWSNDTPSRRVPKVAPSGRMIVGSLLVFALLGAGGFAALYTAVHSNDAANRATYTNGDSQGTMAPTNANGVAPLLPFEPGPTPMSSSVAPETASEAARIDSGAPMSGVTAATTSAPADVHRASAARAIAPAPAPARSPMAPARRAPIVVHVEPAPVYPVSSHHEADDKDGPVSEDAVLAGTAHSAAAAEPQPPTEGNIAAPRGAAPTSPPTSPSNAAGDPVPPGNDENPDDPRK
jgi:hypothetical protein